MQPMSNKMVRPFSSAPFSLPPLPYSKNALAPHISEETLSFHHEKHHQTYVTKLNGFVKDQPALAGKSLEEFIKTAAGGVFNNAAQIWNHTFYWSCLSPNGGGVPKGAIGDLITKQYGSFDKFKEEFTSNCVNHFGSGWVWLMKEGNALKIVQTHDAGCPIA